MEAPKPTEQHQFLMRMLGDWTFEASCDMGPDKPRESFKGKETVRALGDVWILCEGEGESPGGGPSRMIITLGFDPTQNKFVGTFIASMMMQLWNYKGELDAGGTILTLDTEGPDFADPKVLKPYRDVIEIVSADHRILRSQMVGPDGKWVEFMQSHYKRVGG